jgi:hypothetical protein
MDAKPNRGGRPRKSAEEHIRNNTYRPSLHGPRPTSAAASGPVVLDVAECPATLTGLARAAWLAAWGRVSSRGLTIGQVQHLAAGDSDFAGETFGAPASPDSPEARALARAAWRAHGAAILRDLRVMFPSRYRLWAEREFGAPLLVMGGR